MKHLFSNPILASLLVATTAVISSAVFSPANAAALSFTIDEFTGSDARVKFTLDDEAAGAGKIQFKVDYIPTGSNTIADLRGVFFNIANDSLLSGLKVIGANITASKFGPAGTIDQVGSNSNNVNGGNYKFDAGLEIGRQGIGGGDDFQSTTFTLYHTSQALSLAQFSGQNFGARLMSVGSGNNRNGSSKLAGQAPYYTPPPPPPAKVPEPGMTVTFALLAVGAGTLLKKNKQYA
jgi:hypothetical protein